MNFTFGPGRRAWRCGEAGAGWLAWRAYATEQSDIVCKVFYRPPGNLRFVVPAPQAYSVEMKNAQAEVEVVHAAAGAMEDIKLRADFEVYLKKFLQSLNLILPYEAAHVYRGPARRFGYLLRMVKERYKDESIDISDAGAKVRALINEHLIDLGINPTIPPIKLLSPDFLEHVRKHSGGDPEAKASEMEHALRKHCTIHFDEDPAFYQRLSDKLEKLIEAQRDNWQPLAEGYEQLRREAEAGRTETIEGLTKEATTFYDYVVRLAFDATGVPTEHLPSLKRLMSRVVDTLKRYHRHHRFLEKAHRGQEATR